ncbi:MAG: hypothetical protein GY805_15535 [Chloroflexi bacterium]|nr:hypothetical protein [Chloroflexota bacterium]
MFWGDRPERRARRSLSTSLWHIRRCFAPADPIMADNRTVQFVWPGEIWLDAAAFVQAAAAGSTSSAV